MKRQRARTIKSIVELKNKVEDFYNWACELPDYENMSGRASQAEAVLDVLDWVLGNRETVELNSIDAGDCFTNQIYTWNEFYKMLKEEQDKNNKNEEEDE